MKNGYYWHMPAQGEPMVVNFHNDGIHTHGGLITSGMYMSIHGGTLDGPIPLPHELAAMRALCEKAVQSRPIVVQYTNYDDEPLKAETAAYIAAKHTPNPSKEEL